MKDKIIKYIDGSYMVMKKKELREKVTNLERTNRVLRGEINDIIDKDRKEKFDKISTMGVYTCAVCGKRNIEKHMKKYKHKNYGGWKIIHVCKSCDK